MIFREYKIFFRSDVSQNFLAYNTWSKMDQILHFVIFYETYQFTGKTFGRKVKEHKKCACAWPYQL